MWTHKKGDRTNSAAHTFAMKLLARLKATMSIHGMQSGLDRARMGDGTEVTVSWSGSIPTIKIVSPTASPGEECAIYMESGMLDLGVNSAANRWNLNSLSFDSSPATLHFGSGMTCATLGGINGGINFQIASGVGSMTSACLGQSGSSPTVSRLTSPTSKVAQARHPASAYSGLLRRYISAVYGAKYISYSSHYDSDISEYLLKLNDTYVAETVFSSAKYMLTNIALLNGSLHFVLCKRLFSRVCNVAFQAPRFKTKCHEYVYEFWKLRGSSLDDEGDLKILAVAMCGMLPPNADEAEPSFTMAVDSRYSFNHDGTKVVSAYPIDDYYRIVTNTFDVNAGGDYVNSADTLVLDNPAVLATPTGTIERIERVFYEWESKDLSVVTFYSEVQTEEDFLPYSECAVDSWNIGLSNYSIFDSPGWEVIYPLNNVSPTGSDFLAPGISNCSDATKQHRVIEGIVKKTDGVVVWSNTVLLDKRVDTSRPAATYLSAQATFAVDTETDSGSYPTGAGSSSGYAIGPEISTGSATSAREIHNKVPDYGIQDIRVDGCYERIQPYTGFTYGVSLTTLHALCPNQPNTVSTITENIPWTETATGSERDSFVCSGDRKLNVRSTMVSAVKGMHAAIAVRDLTIHGGFHGVYQKGITRWWTGYTIDMASTFEITCPGAPPTTLTYSAGVLFHDFSSSFTAIEQRFMCADASQWPSNMWYVDGIENKSPAGYGLYNQTAPYTPIGDRQKGSFYSYTYSVACVYENIDDEESSAHSQRVFPNLSEPYNWYAANPSYTPVSLDLSYSDCQATLLMFEDIPATHDPLQYEKASAPYTDEIEIEYGDVLEMPNLQYKATSGMLGGLVRPDITLGNAGSLNSDRHVFTGGYPAVNTPSFIGWA